ncbi:hypothetical protein BH11PSE10_BH11PSE10_16230 [soil metagenome]
MRWRCTLAGLLASLAPSASAQATPPTPPPACLIVYGHARNAGDAKDNEAWDRVNRVFNAQVTQRLQDGGQRAFALLFNAGVTEVAGAVAELIALAQRQGCLRVVDTAVFADAAAQTLVVRLRVHPVLGSTGPRLRPAAAPRIGEPIYSSQRDLDLNQRTLERVNLAALAEQMVDDYLAKP